MKKILPILVAFALSLPAFAQTRQEQFKKLFASNDTTRIKILLDEWEKSKPDEPELYTSAMNFYFTQCQQEVISIRDKPSQGESLAVTDSAGKEKGFLTSEVQFNPVYLAMALAYADKGIRQFPNRLDLRFGKCYVLQQTEDYTSFTNEVIAAVQYSAVNKNNWLWTGNKKIEEPEAFLLSTVQEYLKQLYDTENDELLPNIIQIGEATLQLYPQAIEILSTTAVALMLTKKFDIAIDYLKKAEKINPKDFIVLNNIAQGYKMMGDKTNAIHYYELAAVYGDSAGKQQARKNIAELKKTK